MHKCVVVVRHPGKGHVLSVLGFPYSRFNNNIPSSQLDLDLPSTMGEIRMTRDLFLWLLSVIYLFAFTSLYVQIPG